MHEQMALSEQEKVEQQDMNAMIAGMQDGLMPLVCGERTVVAKLGFFQKRHTMTKPGPDGRLSVARQAALAENLRVHINDVAQWEQEWLAAHPKYTNPIGPLNNGIADRPKDACGELVSVLGEKAMKIGSPLKDCIAKAVRANVELIRQTVSSTNNKRRRGERCSRRDADMYLIGNVVEAQGPRKRKKAFKGTKERNY